MSFNIENYFSYQLKNLIFHYKGNVDSNTISRVLDLFDEKMAVANNSSRLRKRAYNVLVESLQNLYHHVDKVPDDFNEQADRFGVLWIIKTDTGYQIVTGNFIYTDNIEKLEKRIQKINSLSREGIRDLYKFILSHQGLSAKGGGGLGLVDIARKTGNKLNYSFVKYNDEYSFFYLNILINEEQKD
ncbi:MAG: SiaB family protein kinase [Bacteroidales bacterium]|jgi:hypothetical protein|nr:SiaB family protein kinase [Bacteroidales bacterium]